MTALRTIRILPRADHLLRYVNSSIIHNLKAEETDTVIVLPGIVSRAYTIVNETTTLEVSDLTSEYELVVRQ